MSLTTSFVYVFSSNFPSDFYLLHHAHLQTTNTSHFLLFKHILYPQEKIYTRQWTVPKPPAQTAPEPPVSTVSVPTRRSTGTTPPHNTSKCTYDCGRSLVTPLPPHASSPRVRREARSSLPHRTARVPAPLRNTHSQGCSRRHRRNWRCLVIRSCRWSMMPSGGRTG